MLETFVVTSRKNKLGLKTEIDMKAIMMLLILTNCAFGTLSSQCLEDNIYLRIDFDQYGYTLNDSTESCLDELIHNFRTVYPKIGKRIVINYYAPNDLSHLGNNVKLIQDYLNSNGIEYFSYKFRFIFNPEVMDSDSDYVWIGIVLNESP